MHLLIINASPAYCPLCVCCSFHFVFIVVDFCCSQFDYFSHLNVVLLFHHQSEICMQWSVVCGHWTVVSGPWSAVCSLVCSMALWSIKHKRRRSPGIDNRTSWTFFFFLLIFCEQNKNEISSRVEIDKKDGLRNKTLQKIKALQPEKLKLKIICSDLRSVLLLTDWLTWPEWMNWPTIRAMTDCSLVPKTLGGEGFQYFLSS